MEKVPKLLHSLLWDYDVESIYVKKHAFLLMSRIMERGTWEAMKWLRKTYTNEELKDFIEKKGVKLLAPRELNYWAFVCGVPDKKRSIMVKEARKIHSLWRGHTRV
jgi:hypothetical protein